MAALAHDLVALLLQRQAVDLDHVVEHAGEHLDHLAVLVPVETRLGPERVAHELGQVDRAEQARAVGRQRLFAAVVRVQAVAVEGVDAGYLHVVDVLDAIGLQRLHGGDKALAVEVTLVARQGGLQTRGLVAVGKADQFGETRQRLAGNHQLVLGPGGIGMPAAMTIGQQAFTCDTAVAIDP